MSEQLPGILSLVQTKEKALKCDSSSEKFIFLYELNRHKTREHGQPVKMEGGKPNYTPKKNYKCDMCAREFSFPSVLRDHLRTHTGERPFKCTIAGCQMTFKVGDSLKSHIKFKHSDERPFKCEFPGCPYKAKTSQKLLQHTKVHSDDRPFACPNEGCNYRAKWKKSITCHVASVHSDAKPFACSQCDYKTATSRSLKRHLMCRHSAIGYFKCSYPHCTKSFNTAHDLKLHFCNQHQNRSYQCDHPGCGLKYVNAKGLSEHKRNVHGKKNHT